MLGTDQSVLNEIHWYRYGSYWKLIFLPSGHILLNMQHTSRGNPPPPPFNYMAPPCSLMLILSVIFVWVSQMAFLPPPSPTPYLSPFIMRRHYYSLHPRLLAYGLKLTRWRGGGGGVVSYVTGGGRRVLSPLTTHWFLFASPFLPPPPAAHSSDRS